MELIVAVLYCTLQINFIPSSPKHSNSDLKPELEELFLFQSLTKSVYLVSAILDYKGNWESPFTYFCCVECNLHRNYLYKHVTEILLFDWLICLVWDIPCLKIVSSIILRPVQSEVGKQQLMRSAY